MEYQYNDLIYVIDNWDTDGNIELRLLKDIDLDKLTYEDLGIIEFYPEDFEILSLFKQNKSKDMVGLKPMVKGKEKYARVNIRMKPPLEVLINHLRREHE